MGLTLPRDALRPHLRPQSQSPASLFGEGGLLAQLGGTLGGAGGGGGGHALRMSRLGFPSAADARRETALAAEGWPPASGTTAEEAESRARDQRVWERRTVAAARAGGGAPRRHLRNDSAERASLARGDSVASQGHGRAEASGAHASRLGRGGGGGAAAAALAGSDSDGTNVLRLIDGEDVADNDGDGTLLPLARPLRQHGQQRWLHPGGSSDSEAHGASDSDAPLMPLLNSASSGHSDSPPPPRPRERRNAIFGQLPGLGARAAVGRGGDSSGDSSGARVQGGGDSGRVMPLLVHLSEPEPAGAGAASTGSAAPATQQLAPSTQRGDQDLSARPLPANDRQQQRWRRHSSHNPRVVLRTAVGNGPSGYAGAVAEARAMVAAETGGAAQQRQQQQQQAARGGSSPTLEPGVGSLVDRAEVSAAISSLLPLSEDAAGWEALAAALRAGGTTGLLQQLLHGQAPAAVAPPSRTAQASQALLPSPSLASARVPEQQPAAPAFEGFRRLRSDTAAAMAEFLAT